MYAVVSSICILLLSGCPPPSPPIPENDGLIPISRRNLPVFKDDMGSTGLAEAVDKSLTYFNRVPQDRLFSYKGGKVACRDMTRLLQDFADFLKTNPDSSAVNQWIGDNCGVFEAKNVLFTGYFEPLLSGAKQPDSRFRHPVYGLPQDRITVDLSLFSEELAGRKIVGRLVDNTLVPYPDREQIDGNKMIAGMAPVLAWVDDPVGLFFLHIQGSGQIRLQDGANIRVGYAGTNGRAYRSIGKLLIDEGKIPLEQMSMQEIRSYLAQRPQEARRVMNYNPSYVFFKIEPDGPLGSLGVKLTPGRSVAMDSSMYPNGALCVVQTKIPLANGGGIQKWQDIQRVVLHQDSGGAIKGLNRADLFFGNGPYAELAAGHMRQRGRIFLLMPKSKTE